MSGQTRNIPTVFIIFGATGDLMTKKIIPALFHLYQNGNLPKLFQIIGFSRRDLDEPGFRNYVRDIIKKQKTRHISEHKIDEFLKLIRYQKGNFDTKAAYKTLASSLGIIDDSWSACSNKLFYLAVPPQFYKTILEHLAESKLTIPCGGEEGWTRILIEKPFGSNLETAKDLDLMLGNLFQEEQLYRIDHYLGKAMLQNILEFRFSNALFEGQWNNRHIKSIEVRLLEKMDVENRGAFYDNVGALRDVGQNHILQMLSLVTMDRPRSFRAPDVRQKRAEVFKALQPLKHEEVITKTKKGQYVGYKKTSGVAKDSKTETYFKIQTELASNRWRGVPIILEGGKAIAAKKEIIVTFKAVQNPSSTIPEYENRIVFRLEPKEEIVIEFWAKKPGLEFKLEKQRLAYLFRDARKKIQYREEYEKLLLDCIIGNQLLFVSTDEISSTWRFTDSIHAGWGKHDMELLKYDKGKTKILKEASFEEERHVKQVGIIGLGKMGGNIARRLRAHGWNVVAYNRTQEVLDEFLKDGGSGASTVSELIEKLSTPRVILLSLPAGDATNKMIDTLLEALSPGDTIIDGANAYYKESIKNAKKVVAKKIHYFDAGISGGPGGALNGACIMVGGSQTQFPTVEPLLHDMAAPNAVAFFEGYGAGHFVKMVHNGIEYGMMQSLAEGFDILKNAPFKLDLEKVTEIYNNGSVIESRLVGWLADAFQVYGQDLKSVSGSVGHTGEGAYTVTTAKELKIKAKVIEDALQFRIDSEKNPSYTGKLLSGMRNQFGGHSIK